MKTFESCDKCKYNSKSESEYPCNQCVHNATDKFKPITNADRVRSMSDEELAEFLLKVNTAYAEPCMTGESDCKWEDYPTHDKGCKNCFLEWLQSEAEQQKKNLKGSD